MKLNQSERKVLSLLEQDGRLPATRIAKKTRLSTEGVIKVIKRLSDRGVIQKFNTKINYSRMGYRLYPVHIKLAKRNEEVIGKITEVIKKHFSCTWHIFCEGEYDLLLSFKILEEKDKEDMEEMLGELSEYILEKDISVVLYALEINKSFLPKKEPTVLMIFDFKAERIHLKTEEFKMISLLKKNSRETILNLAKQLKVTPRVAMNNIKKLQKSGVISGFKTKVNMAALGYQPCTALMTINKCSKKEYDLFISYCKQTKGIHYFLRQLGKYDVVLTFDVESIRDFYELIDNLRDRFPFIRKITTLVEKKPHIF
ncbi:Lrp/AsnC family transcriptional regulator [Candidatus Woesearchaeota archaeon]|jgi:Lrp/AsnC family transcriptional regulator, leucine-responsive regulatory protein|nr:Lrp/AsnC family transcriptional regulator [Candidatus Woesearchaeota archaeon]